ncbi:MAG: GyrI-like domain-containing protein [Gemmatimonas sp.]
MNTPQHVITESAVTPRSLAGVRARVPMGRVPEFIRPNLDQVYAAAKAGKVAVDGQNVFLYQPRPDGALDIAFCVGTAEPFDQVGNVEFMQTPAGIAATTTHWGDYSGLRQAHDTLQAWCRTHKRKQAGPSWEVYGHWSENPAQLRTDIFYLLASS